MDASLGLGFSPFSSTAPPRSRLRKSLSRRRRKPCATLASVGEPPLESRNPFPGKPEADIVVIGSGIGGLCCSGLLARYQQDVLVLESHDLPGGAAHSFDVKGYKFDSGPSLFSGFQSRGLQANPLAQVLDALGESIPCASYNSWMVYIPEGEFLSRIGPTEFLKDKLEGAAAFCRALHEKLQQLFLVLCSPKDVNIQTIAGASEQCNCLPSKILAHRGQAIHNGCIHA